MSAPFEKSPEPDLNFVLRRLDTIQRELHDGLHTMALRDEQREASYQAMIQTLTRQMVQVAGAIEPQLAGVNDRLNAIADRLDGLETTLAAIVRKLR